MTCIVGSGYLQGCYPGGDGAPTNHQLPQETKPEPVPGPADRGRPVLDDRAREDGGGRLEGPPGR